MARPISPLNDFVRQVFLEEVDPTTGVIAPVTTGTITGFLATSRLPTATTYDATWSVSGAYIGGANGYVAGTWQFAIGAAVLTAVKVAAAAAAGSPVNSLYFIVERASGVRVYEPLRYLESLAAEIR